MFRPSILSCLISDNKRICELLGFLIRVTEVSSLLGCDAMSQSSDGDRGMLRHILEERRPQHKQSLQILSSLLPNVLKFPTPASLPNILQLHSAPAASNELSHS